MALLQFVLPLWTALAFTGALGQSAATNASNTPAPFPDDDDASVVLNGASPLNNFTSCCAALDAYFPGSVFTPKEIQYNQTLQAFWSQQEQQVSPACVVVPENTSDVSNTIATLRFGIGLFNDDRCRFAVKSGGHTPFAGAANVQDGITIDLGKLNAVEVTANRTQVSVGPGATWRDVYMKLDALGLATSGGRAASVGVGGLTLGGGFSFFSPRIGLVCDNVINFEVVLPSGYTVVANENSYPDLFKALKGGSSNFGIVTRIDLKAFEQGNFWGGFIAHDISTAPKQFSYFEAFARGGPSYDRFATLINSYSWTSQTQWLVASSLEYTKPQTNASVFSNFTTALPKPLLSTMRISNMTDFTTEISAKAPPGFRDTFVTATYKNSAVMQAKYFELANDTITKTLASVPGLTFSLSFQPEPQSILAPLSSPPGTTESGNSLGLTASDGDLVNVLLTASWTNASDDSVVKSAAREMFDAANTFAESNGFFHPYLYLNYAAEWQDPLGGYGAESVAFLKKVSAKYDKKGLFQTQVKGGFRLRDAGNGGSGSDGGGGRNATATGATSVPVPVPASSSLSSSAATAATSPSLSESGGGGRP